MALDFLERVRNGCKAVAEQAKFVRMDKARIPAYTASLPLERIRQPEHDAATHYLGHGDDTAAFFVTLDTINFGSGYFPHLIKRPGMSGYFTVASSFNDHYRKQGPISASTLARISVDDCTRLFGQDPNDTTVRELMQLFATALNNLGLYLQHDFDSQFTALIESAGGKAERLVQLLIQMPFFNDVETYASMNVPFFKRAQLMAADLALAFHRQGLGHFTDLDRLTMFADNLVPHVLRVDGLLKYDESLAHRIDAELLIPSGSPEEVEMRACALHTVELLAEELRSKGQVITPMQLDYLLWNRGQEPDYKRAKPRHRTRTVFY